MPWASRTCTGITVTCRRCGCCRRAPGSSCPRGRPGSCAGAAEAMRLVGPGQAVPIHWGTLWPMGCGRVRPDRFTRPGDEFAAHTAQLAPETDVAVLAPGESLSVAERG